MYVLHTNPCFSALTPGSGLPHQLTLAPDRSFLRSLYKRCVNCKIHSTVFWLGFCLGYFLSHNLPFTVEREARCNGISPQSQLLARLRPEDWQFEPTPGSTARHCLKNKARREGGKPIYSYHFCRLLLAKPGKPSTLSPTPVSFCPNNAFTILIREWILIRKNVKIAESLVTA